MIQGDWYTECPAELLEMRGKEGLDLLQRISTNELARLEIGSWIPTILTTEKGRMIDVVWVGRRSEDLLIILAVAHRAEKAKDWIEKFIIMEDVQIEAIKQRFVHLVVVGEVEFQRRVWLLEFRDPWGDVHPRHLLVPEENKQEMVELLEESGAGRRSFTAYEDFRITAGIPMGKNEVSEGYNPLEAGLGDLVSWTKGCYVGQEVIARLDTYKKVQRQLVRVDLSKQPGVTPLPIRGASGEAGVLTSVTANEPFVGFAYVGRKYVEQREEMYMETKGGTVGVKFKE